MSVVLAGMAQLLGLMGEMNKKRRDPASPDAVKPGVTALPLLPEPGSDGQYVGV